MMRIIITIFIFHFVVLCYAQHQKPAQDTSAPIPYNTVILKNNYKLIFSTTDKSRLLQLIGPTIDTAIISKSIKTSEGVLGWLQHDFVDYFMMYSDTELDTTVRVFRKQDGKQLFFGRFLSINKQYNVLIYVDWKELKLGLFDMNAMKVELFNPPKTPCGFWWQCVASLTLTEKELTVEYAVLNLKREKKVYVR